MNAPRIAWLATLAVAISATLSSGPSGAQQPKFDGVTIRVATFGGGWGDVLNKHAGEEFRKTGGKVEILPSFPRDALAKLIAARGRPAPFDVVEMDESTFDDFLGAGFIEKINLAMVPNTKDLDRRDFDDMRVASWITQEGILYRPDKYKEAGIPAPERYSDLANPKLGGRVSMIDISQTGVAQVLVGAAVDAGGSEANLGAAYDLLKKINAVRYWKLGAEALSALQTGDAWAATVHSGFALQARDAGHAWVFVHPKVGTRQGLLKTGYVGVVKGTRAADAAAWFINCYIGTANQEAISTIRGVVSPNKAVRAAVKDHPKLKDHFILDEAQVANMVRIDFKKLDPNYKEQWTRATVR